LHNLAVFIDYENLALAQPQGRNKFEIRRILDRLVEKGKVVSKVAYCDWSRFRKQTSTLHESGVALVEIPHRAMTGKNSADIRLVVDAMEMCHTKDHVDTFVIVSGDSDFSPLVSQLKANGKTVIGVGMRESTSDLLAENCDEFLFYEDLVEAPKATSRAGIPEDKKDAWTLLFDTVRALQREGHDRPQASLVKDTMRRKRPSFSETALGYDAFSDLLEDVRDAGFLELEEDPRSGTWVVTRVKRRRNRRSRS
jgi:uncharacterized protein (TIGR00288 family)